MRRRGLAMLLSLLMLLGAAPVGALAAAGTEEPAAVSVKADNKGEAQVGDTDLEAAIAAAGGGAVEVQVSLPKEPDRLSLTLPTASLKTLSAQKDAQLTVTSSLVDVSLDAEALSAVVNQATGQTVILTVTKVPAPQLSEYQRQVANGGPVYDLSLKSGEGYIATFGGGVVSVTLPYELPAGRKAAGVVVQFMDSFGTLTDCDTSYDVELAEVYFTTRHFSLYVIGYEEPMDMPFTDVTKDHWAYNEIDWAYTKGLMTGKTATTFQPNGVMTRQQVWMILARLSGATPANMAQAKDWAVKSGISDGSDPGAVITRQQLVTLLYRYAVAMGYPMGGKADLGIYSDTDQIASYAVEAMSWAVGNNVVGGTLDGRLAPGATATRAQFAAIVWRFWSVAF